MARRGLARAKTVLAYDHVIQDYHKILKALIESVEGMGPGVKIEYP
jgi:hypothetical protein